VRLKSSVGPVGIEIARGANAIISSLSSAFIEVSTIALSMSIGHSGPSIAVCFSGGFPPNSRKPHVGCAGFGLSKRKTGKALVTPPSTSTPAFFVCASVRLSGGKKYGSPR
jgi:hypothetical protein